VAMLAGHGKPPLLGVDSSLAFANGN
jgi:hypothetical protein